MVSSYASFGNLDKQALIHSMGLDVPVMVQYGRFMSGVFLHGDLGKSLFTGTPIINDIIKRLPVTFELGLLAIIVAQIIALPIGIYSALRQDTVGDYIARSFAILCIAVPGFWLATLVIVFPSIWWGYMPSLKLIQFTQDPIGNLKMFIVPGIVLGLEMSGMTMRMTRTMMLEVLRQDYIRTAWAKGLRERVVIIRHALKNALIPIVTIIGFQMPILIGGTVIIENIFVLPGMGQLMVNATVQRDYPVVSGVLLFLAAVMVLINLVVDLTYGFLDPRVHYK
jgi:peptide/nickel transport system permease protein